MTMPNCIELSVRLTDGSFESRISIPTNAGADQHKALVLAWYKLMEEALAVAKSLPSEADSSRSVAGHTGGKVR